MFQTSTISIVVESYNFISSRQMHHVKVKTIFLKLMGSTLLFLNIGQLCYLLSDLFSSSILGFFIFSCPNDAVMLYQYHFSVLLTFFNLFPPFSSIKLIFLNQQFVHNLSLVRIILLKCLSSWFCSKLQNKIRHSKGVM